MLRTRTKLQQVELSTLAYYQKYLKIYLDDAFQSEERWTLKDKQEYIASVLEGRAVTSIILAHLSSIVPALELAYGKAHEDTVFFQNLLDQGYEYITIDGNNRDRCICDFIEGNFPLKEMTYNLGEDGMPTFTPDMSNKYTQLYQLMSKLLWTR